MLDTIFLERVTIKNMQLDTNLSPTQAQTLTLSTADRSFNQFLCRRQ